MKLKFLLLTALLSMSLTSFAQEEEEVEFENEETVVEVSEASEENLDQPSEEPHKTTKNEIKTEIFKEESKEKSLDEIEAEAQRLARLAKKLEKKAEELQKKADKMAKKSENMSEKSEKFEEKSEKLVEVSNTLSEDSKKNIEESEKLSQLIAESPDKANRDEAIRKLCQERVSRGKLLKILDRRSEDKKLESCIVSFREGSLKKKKKLQKAHVGKQCSINLGISIECPEGTYKFIGNDGLANVSGEERSEKKEVVGENNSSENSSQSVAAK